MEIGRIIKKIYKSGKAVLSIARGFDSISFSQAGEDSIVKFLFNDIGQQSIKYLDIGANKPIGGNNTYLFYLNGSDGVLVEADSTLIAELKSKRKKDRVLHLGISVNSESEADFYIFNHSGVNTFDKEQAEIRLKSGTNKLLKVVKTKLLDINTLIKENFDKFPDFMSLDIEGIDYDVLQQWDHLKFPISVICAETCEYSENHIRTKNHKIISLMKSKGYFVYADTYVNTIFVQEDWFYKRMK